MRMILSMFLTFVFFCTSSSVSEAKSKYIKMHELWKMNASTEDVKKVFGPNFDVVDFGVAYNFPNSKFPELGFFFDSSNRLDEQFAFLNEASILDFKKTINCEWKETEEIRDIAHYQRVIKKGVCLDPSIRYETYLGLNGYEVRWKR